MTILQIVFLVTTIFFLAAFVRVYRSEKLLISILGRERLKELEWTSTVKSWLLNPFEGLLSYPLLAFGGLLLFVMALISSKAPPKITFERAFIENGAFSKKLKQEDLFKINEYFRGLDSKPEEK